MYSPSARLTELISSYLGDFFERVEKDHLQLGLWQGDLSLQNLRFREDALVKFWPDAPLSVHEGVVGAFRLKIPWGSLTTGKASLILHNVKLCLHPRAVDGPPTPDVLHAMEAAAQFAKQAIVQRAEEELYNLKGDASRRSWGSSLLTSIATSVLMKVLQNMEVDVRNLDMLFHHEHKSAASLSFSRDTVASSSSSVAASFASSSTSLHRHDELLPRPSIEIEEEEEDEDEEEGRGNHCSGEEETSHDVVGIHILHIHMGFLFSGEARASADPASPATPSSLHQGALAAGVRQLISKTVVVDGVGMYVHNQSLLPSLQIEEEDDGDKQGCPAKAAAPGGPSTTAATATSTVDASSSRCLHRRCPADPESPFWMVKPFSLSVAYRASADHPKHGLVQDLNVEVAKEIRININREHYLSLAALSRSVHTATTQLRYWTLRPKASVKMAPAAWWRYAKDVVVAEVRRQEQGRLRVSFSSSSGNPVASSGSSSSTTGRRRSWGSLVERAKLRDQYLLCYRRLLAAAGPARSFATSMARRDVVPTEVAEVAQELASLELELTAEEILLYRAVGRTKAKLDGLAEGPGGRSVFQSLRHWMATPSSYVVTTAGIPSSWSSPSGTTERQAVAGLTSESTLDDVADALFCRYGRSSNGGHLGAGASNSASLEDTGATSAYLHVNVHLQQVSLALDALQYSEQRVRKVLNLAVSGVQGELWMAIPGEEMGLNASVDVVAATDACGEKLLDFGRATTLSPNKAPGRPALLLHLDLCPQATKDGGDESAAVTEFTLGAYLSKSQLRHKQLTVEMRAAPLWVHVTPALLRDLRELIPVSESPFCAAPHFQALRYLAACRKAYAVPSHVDFILRQHVTVNLAVSLESIELRLGALLRPDGEGDDVVAHLKGLRLFHGAYLEALLLADQEASIEETFILKHDLKPPTVRAQRLLHAQSSAYVERTYVSLPSISLDVLMAPRDADGEIVGDEAAMRLPLLTLPVAAEVVATMCILPGHPGYPRSRLDVHLSPLEFRVSPRRLEVVTSTVHAFRLSERTKKEQQTGISARGVPAPPRLFLLSNLVDSLVEVVVDSVAVAVYGDRDFGDLPSLPLEDELSARAARLIADTVEAWVHFSDPGKPSDIIWKLAKCKIVEAGFSTESAEQALGMLVQEFRSKSFLGLEAEMQGGSADKSKARAILNIFAVDVGQRLGRVLLPDMAFLSKQCPLFYFVAKGLGVSCVKLTYDERLSVSVEKCFAEDEGRCLVFQVAVKPAAGLTTTGAAGDGKKLGRSTPMKPSTHRAEVSTSSSRQARGQQQKQKQQLQVQEAAVLHAHAKALTVIMTKQDHECGWGRGGSSTASLRRAELGLTGAAAGKFDQHTTIRLSDLSVIFKLDRVAAQLDDLGSIVQRLLVPSAAPSVSMASTTSSRRSSGAVDFSIKEGTEPSVPVEQILDLRWASGSMMFVNEGKAYFKVVSDHVSSEVIQRSQGGKPPLALSSLAVTCENMLVEDLTPGGEDYPVVISRLSEKSGGGGGPSVPPPPIFSVRYRRGALPDLQMESHRMRVCFTFRFLKLYLGMQNAGILPLVQKVVNFPNGIAAVPPVASPPSIPSSSAPEAAHKWAFGAHDVTIILPQNSGETDLGALKARYLHVDSQLSKTTWRLPEAHDVSDATNAADEVPVQQSRPSPPHAAVDELFYSVSAGSAARVSFEDEEEDEGEFFDAEEGDASIGRWGGRRSCCSAAPYCGNVGAAGPVLSKEGACHRYAIAARDVQLLAAVVTKITKADDLSQSRVWGSVEDGQPVYASAQPASAPLPGASCDFHWEELTKDTTSFDFYWDSLDEARTRYLLAFLSPSTARAAAAFDAQVTMTQLYLLFSVWYDNMSEGPRFYAPDDLFAREASGSAPPVLFPDIWPAYDTRPFFQRLADHKAVWDFGLIAPTLSLALRLDRDTFLVQPPSFFMAENGLRPPVLEVAQIDLGNAYLNVSGGEGAVKLSFGAGYMQAVDLRVPRRTLQRQFLRCGAPLSTVGPASALCVPGFVVPDFGFTTDLKSVAPALPLQVTLSMTPDNWMCINVGLKDAEALHKDLSLVWLVVDIFSYYFRFPIYGKPDLTVGATTMNGADDQSPRVLSGGSQNLLLSGGTDVRVWATRPCVSAPEDALAKDTATLVVHCGADLFYRYKGDMVGSTLTHVRGEALSLGLGTGFDAAASVKRLLCEGQWGPSVADSRIVVDGLSLDLLYCYDRDSNHLEVQASLPAIEKIRNVVSSPFPFDKKPLEDPFVQPPPFAVHPLEMPSRNLTLPGATPASTPRRPCYIMGSHVDLAFILGTVTVFVGPTPEALADVCQELRGFHADAPHRARSREGRKGLRSAFATHFQLARRAKGAVDSSSSSAQPACDPALSKTLAAISASALDDGAGDGDEDDEESALTCQVTVEVASLKLLLLDPILGLHLPLIKLVVGELHAMVYHGPMDVGIASGAAAVPDGFKLGFDGGQLGQEARSQSLLATSPSTGSPRRILSRSLNVSLHVRVWSDYFNIALKCWEPLLEPFACRALYEDGHARGRGLTVRSHCPLLVNVSSAFLQTLGYTTRLAQQINPDVLHFDKLYLLLFTTAYEPRLAVCIFNSEALGSTCDEDLPASSRTGALPIAVEEVVRLEALASSLFSTPGSDRLCISHEFPKPLLPETRAPFSICNLTGQVVRCFQPHAATDKAAMSLQYLKHGAVSRLSFGATMTVLQNLQSLEVPFDVNRDLFLPDDEQAANSRKMDNASTTHGCALPSAALAPHQLRHQQQHYPRLLDKGWSISVQLGGYRWLTCVSADALGVRFESLRPLPGHPEAERLLGDWKVHNALKLVSEVRLLDGCRQLTLRSVFRVRNCTKHDIVLVAHSSPDHRPSRKDFDGNDGAKAGGGPSGGMLTTLAPGGTYNVPFELLRLAAETGASSGFLRTLGRLWVKPKVWPVPIAGGAKGKHPRRTDEVHFSTEPVDLKMLVDESARLFEASLHHHGGHDPSREVDSPSFAAAVLQRQARHLFCPLLRVSNQPAASSSSSSASSSSTSPPVSYCVEVVRTELKKGGTNGSSDELMGAAVKEVGDASRKRTGAPSRWNSRKGESVHDPVEYMVLIHPPLVLENLLPEACIFELHDFRSKALLWKAHLQAGQSLPAHDVRLDCPLMLVIQTEYCRSPEGALIHKGSGGGGGGAGAGDNEVAKSIVMVDTENQKLLLELHHQVGGAGQRRTTVYCPYWLVNNTNCLLTYLQEGKSTPPAGTLGAAAAAKATASATTPVIPTGAGPSDTPTTTSPGPGKGAPPKPPMAASGGIGHFRPQRREDSPSKPLPMQGVDHPQAGFSPLNISSWNKKRHKQYPGEEGLSHFHRKVKGGLRTSTTKMSTHFTDSYDLDELCEASFMFNFAEDTVLTLGQQRLKVKVNDSGWSKGFSLDTVGVNQVLTVRHPQWGDMEIGFVINLAPGRLGQFTKVVFFCPRYVVWNRHPLPLYLSQDSTYFRLGHISDEIGSHRIAQAHLPRSTEKRVTVQLKGNYDKSTPFLIDDGVDLCLKLSRQTDLSRVKHLMTRKAPEFDIVLPPNQEIGLWLETDWNHENLIVKGLKANRWAGKTEIQKGDVLLTIEGQSIAGKNFKKVMAALKELLATSGAMLRFRTHEEDMRLLRMRALGQQVVDTQQNAETGNGEKEGAEYITVQLKPVGPSVYVIVNKLDPSMNPPYRIVNKTKNFMIHFRQLGCESHPWVSLAPHESSMYAWEEPMKPHKLDLRVAIRKGMPGRRASAASVPGAGMERRGVSRRGVPNEFAAKNSAVRVRLDEIGFAHAIPLQEPYTDDGRSLIARVGTEGTTRVLYVSKDGSAEESVSVEKRQEELAKLRQMYVEHRDVYSQLTEELAQHARQERFLSPQRQLKALNLSAVEGAIGNLQAELHNADPHIRERHHLLVEVKEAKGLRAGDISGLSDPFVQVSLKIQDRLFKRDPAYQQQYTTYVIEKSLNPKWQNQLFIFKVPPQAIANPKAYSIHVKVKDFDGPVKKSDFLGRIDMQLDVLENESELDGWYFLTPRPRLFQQSVQTGADQPDLGAIHLRMRWVHSLEGLVSNLEEWTESKLQELEIQQQQMEKEKLEQGDAADHHLQLEQDGPINHRKLANVRIMETRPRDSPNGPQGRGGRLAQSVRGMFGRDPDDPDSPSPLLLLPEEYPGSPPPVWERQGSSSSRDGPGVGFSLPEPPPLDQVPLSPPDTMRARVALSRWRKRQLVSHPLQHSEEDARGESLQHGGSHASASISTSLHKHSNSHVGFAAEFLLRGVGAPTFMRPRSYTAQQQAALHAPSRANFPKHFLSRGPTTHSTRRLLATQHGMARRSFEQEVARSHRCVNNPGGTLRIRPLQALNLGEKTKSIYVTVRYGLHLQRTGKAKPGVYPRWEAANGRNELALQVEHLNTTGSVHITVWSEHELQDVELGHIEVPLGSLIDCCDDHGDYMRWFPLLHSADAQSVEGDTARALYPWTSEKASSDDFANEACLKLGFRWVPLDKSQRALRTSSYLRAYLTEMSVSIVDSYQRTELLSLTIRSVEARYVDNPALTRASLVVSCVQLDNQLPKAEAPIVFGPTPMQMSQPLLQCSLFRQKDRNEVTRPDHLYRLKYVFVLLQEVDVKIEEDFLHALWQSFSRVLVDHLVTTSTLYDQKQQQQEQQLQQQQHHHQQQPFPSPHQQQQARQVPKGVCTTPPARSVHSFATDSTSRHSVEDRFAGVHSPSREHAIFAPGVAGHGGGEAEDNDSDAEEDAYSYMTQMVYIEQLELCPVKVNISFFKNAADRKLWKAAAATTSNTAAAAAATTGAGALLGGMDTSHLIVNGQLTSAAARRNPRVASIFTKFQLLTDVVLPLVPSISGASIKLNALDIAHVFQSPTEISATLQAHYTSNFLFQLYKILGSVDIIGNPLSFASSLGTGMIDFFYEPAQGLVKSPKAFVRGVVKGTSSLVTNTTSGFLGVAGKISKSVGSGVLFTISKDQRFMQSRERLAKEQNKVYVRPVKDFFHGVFHGVTGIVADPYYGARRDGCRGFLVGCGHGLVGVVAKPIVGVLDAVAHTSEGFRDLAMVISMEKRLDPVRRHRLQHTFANDGRLLPYDTKLARGVLILQQFSRKSSKKKLGSSSVLPVNEEGDGGATAGLKADMGGAMAAVEAAGRTVFISTKNVVSAVAGTLNIVEAREETLETWGFDTDDTVILTEIITKEPTEETLIVISTKRVVCADCSYKGGSAPEVHLLWQAPLKAIRDVDLKSTPLVLTFHIDRQAAKTAATSPGPDAHKSGLSGAGDVGAGRIEEQSHAQPQPSHHSNQQIVQKRLLGDWQHDNVAFMRVYNLIKCLLGRLDEVDVDMGYGFGVRCNNGGFQFGVWEFAPVDPTLRALPFPPIPRTHGLGIGAPGRSVEDPWSLLEQARWADGVTEGGLQKEILLFQPTQNPQTDPMLAPSQAVGSITARSTSTTTTATNSSKKGTSVALPRIVPSIFFQADASSRPETIAARSTSTSSSRTQAGPRPPPPTSASGVGQGPSQHLRSPPQPTTSGSQQARSTTKVLIEEETLQQLLSKIDMLDARLNEFEHDRERRAVPEQQDDRA